MADRVPGQRPADYGDSTRKLIDFARGEPDPSPFQPPAEHTVVTQDTERPSN
jgi:hypothetical protein